MRQVHSTPVEGRWYSDVGGNTSFEVLSIDERSKSVIVHFNTGSVEEIDLDMWSDMNLKAIAVRDKWGDAHSHAFDIMDDYDDIYNTDSLHLTIEPDEE